VLLQLEKQESARLTASNKETMALLEVNSPFPANALPSLCISIRGVSWPWPCVPDLALACTTLSYLGGICVQDVRKESSRREEDVKRLLSQLQTAETTAKANEQVRIAKEHAEKQIELVKKTAEEDLRALKNANELDLRSSRENALHEVSIPSLFPLPGIFPCAL
jgi:uncharacterized protein YegP (UPF0339 family)